MSALLSASNEGQGSSSVRALNDDEVKEMLERWAQTRPWIYVVPEGPESERVFVVFARPVRHEKQESPKQ